MSVAASIRSPGGGRGGLAMVGAGTEGGVLGPRWGCCHSGARDATVVGHLPPLFGGSSPRLLNV